MARPVCVSGTFRLTRRAEHIDTSQRVETGVAVAADERRGEPLMRGSNLPIFLKV